MAAEMLCELTDRQLVERLSAGQDAAVFETLGASITSTRAT
jgi:hypothetical protein